MCEADSLEELRETLGVCQRCPLSQSRNKLVYGAGNPDADVMFVGEAPGRAEDAQGLPFVGPAGHLLDDLLTGIGLAREDVYITNVVKCRPPANRDPEPNEIAACAPFLSRQLEILDPAVVVTLGRHSLQTFNPGARIGVAHGTLRPVDPQTGAPNALTFAMYHPAAALRQGSLKQTMLEDMCGLPDALIESRRRRGAVSEEVAVIEAEQSVGSEPLVEVEPIALDVEPELVAVAVAAGGSLSAVIDDALPVDENQMSLF
ncbi:MAG TPA: uracil-DNA glycosylase [Coriobacteriia bacterium]